MNNTAQYLRIFIALLRRDLKIVKKRFLDTFLDAFVVACSYIVIFAGLLPKLGMPAEFIGPLYIGSMVSFLFWLGSGFADKHLFDLDGDRYIDYHLILPLPKRWLFAEYICYFIIESTLIVLPLTCIGLWFLSPYLSDVQISWWFFALMFFELLLFFGLLFLGLCLYYDFDWYIHNVWPRRLSPLFVFSANFFIWKTVYQFSTFFGILLLFNPCTYLAEGLRNAIFLPTRFIPWYICATGGLFFIALGMLLLWFGIKKRLDPV